MELRSSTSRLPTSHALSAGVSQFRQVLRPRIVRARVHKQSDRQSDHATEAARPDESFLDVSDVGQAFPLEAVETDSEALRLPWYRVAFTRRREVFVGRLAMLGFFSANVGELLTGKGIFGQVEEFTGWPEPVVATILLGIAANNLLAATTPSSPTWSPENRRDVEKRFRRDPFREPLKALPFTRPGFTKRNELDLGRLAMLGFAAGTVGEIFTGKGPLGQLGLHVEIPIVRGLGLVGLLSWSAFWIVVARRLGKAGQLQGDNDVY